MALYTIDARHQIKRVTTTGATPTIPPTNDFTDGTWSITDTRVGEFFFNAADNRLWIGNLSGFSELDLVESGSTDFDFCSTGIKTSSLSGCSGGGLISLHSPNSISITTDNGNFGSDYLFMQAGGGAGVQLYSTGSTAIYGGFSAKLRTLSNGISFNTIEVVDATDSIRLFRTYGIGSEESDYFLAKDNSSTISTTNDHAIAGVFIGSQNSQFNSGITNSVILGGSQITGETSDTVYLPKLKLQPTTTLPNPEQGMIFFSGSPLNRIMYNTGGTSADWIII
jgi:hypothetical protein